MTVEVITNVVGLQAILVHGPIDRRHIKELHRMAADEFTADPDLAKRWGVWAVLCDPDWAATQKRRVPLVRPTGLRMLLSEAADPGTDRSATAAGRRRR